ncbi:MAG TPA: hypothetical protein PKH02_00595 [Bacteroidales bacterium]|nr:hypothetical protein [Bacteroidales bacterium]HPT11049.1 hypothetical protein [Bacteroidales bacterium]
MRRYNLTITALLGALIVHLVVAIVFISMKISTLHDDMADAVVVSVEQVEEEPPPPEEKKPAKMTLDQLIENGGVDQMVNVVKNLSDKPVNIDPIKYQEMVKDELVQSGKLSTSNYIDEQKQAEEASREEISVDKKEQPAIEIKKKKDLDKNITFKGPTRISYLLENRHHTFLPIPIYMCEGAGQITLAIDVDRQGNVLKAVPTSDVANTTDECLIETAREYGMKAIFNSDPKAPEIESGFLTFVFVSQKKR